MRAHKGFITVMLYCFYVQLISFTTGELIKIAQQLEDDSIIPDVIDNAPASILQVIYNGTEIRFGNIYTPSDVKDEPHVTWNWEANSHYTLYMADLDSPLRAFPKFREWRNWLVGNIPENNVPLGETLVEYVGPAIPRETGLHRYVFLLYKQPGKLIFNMTRIPKSSGKKREEFRIRTFADIYLLGEPIAVNYFQARWDKQAPLTFKQLDRE